MLSKIKIAWDTHSDNQQIMFFLFSFQSEIAEFFSINFPITLTHYSKWNCIHKDCIIKSVLYDLGLRCNIQYNTLKK